MELSGFATFNLAIIVLFVGKLLNGKVGFLKEFNIPEPVTGGLLCALVISVIYAVTGKGVSFNMDVRDFLLIYFFTGIGLNARFKLLLQGGKALVFLLLATVVYMGFQNVVGVSMATFMGESPFLGLLGGTISLIGGHGTTIAWAPTLQNDYGVQGAMEIGIACATFGLVLASLMGGPIAKYLIGKHNLHSEEKDNMVVGLKDDDSGRAKLNYLSILYSLLILNVAMIFGGLLNEGLEAMGIKMPLFVTCLFAAILMTNLIPDSLRLIPRFFPDISWPSGTQSLALISDLSLSIFLTMSLMSLQLWVLIDLAGPIVAILGAQFLMAVIYNIFVIFKLMGRDFEAAVVCSGFGGISLGSTPTAIANMTAVTKKFGPAQKAFIVVPLVSAFFIDIVNATYIQLFLSILK